MRVLSWISVQLNVKQSNVKISTEITMHGSLNIIKIQGKPMQSRMSSYREPAWIHAYIIHFISFPHYFVRIIDRNHRVSRNGLPVEQWMF